MATATDSKPEAAKDPWEMTAGSASSGTNFFPCPPGTHPGTIVGVFDVGYQQEFSQTKNETVEVRKLVLVVELAKKMPDGSGPFVLMQRYTWSMRDNSNFYKVVTTLTGKKFAEGEKFNPLSLLGKPVMAAVSNTQNGEKTYHNLDGLLQYPDGFPAIEPLHFPLSWSVASGEPFPAGTEWLPWVYGKTIEALAQQSAEWRKRHGGTAPAAAARPAAAASGAEQPPF